MARTYKTPLSPALILEWNEEKNGDLTPDMVGAHSTKKVWWLGRCGHEWQAVVERRTQGTGCPYCTGQRVLKGFNDLATKLPDVAAEWNAEKNGDLTPSDVFPGTSKKVWWVCEKGHEWQAAILSRKKGSGCPFCANRRKQKYVGELTRQNPVLSAEWNDEKNGCLTPDMFSAYTGKKVWWVGKCGHEWQASVNARSFGAECPYCSGKKLLKGLNDLATTDPAIAAEWHPTKNGDLTPSDVMANNHEKVWWLGECGHEWETSVKARKKGSRCPICAMHDKRKRYNRTVASDAVLSAEWHHEKNGELKPESVAIGSRVNAWWLGECGHEWQARVFQRARGSGCPYCSGRRLLSGFNDLATTNPALAAEWDYDKNGDLTPSMVSAHSLKKVWWIGRCGHEWETTVASRSQGNACPYCSGKKVMAGFNDLATTNPTLAAEWDYDKNGDLTPDMVTAHSTKKVWWIGRCGHEWEAPVGRRSNGGGCPCCYGHKVVPGYNDLATTNPALAAEWHPENNGDITPEMVTAGCGKYAWWQCKEGHAWRAVIKSRNKGRGCPYCAAVRIHNRYKNA